MMLSTNDENTHMQMTTSIVAVSVAIVAAGCRGGPGHIDDALTGPSAVPSALQDGTSEIAVSRVRVFIKDRRPQAYVEAPLGGGCTNLDQVIQRRRDHTIIATMTATTKGAPCTMIFEYVSHWVPLDGTFDPGLYMLRVNRTTQEFRVVPAASGESRIEPDPGPLPTIRPPCQPERSASAGEFHWPRRENAVQGTSRLDRRCPLRVARRIGREPGRGEIRRAAGVRVVEKELRRHRNCWRSRRGRCTDARVPGRPIPDKWRRCGHDCDGHGRSGARHAARKSSLVPDSGCLVSSSAGCRPCGPWHVDECPRC